MALRTGLITGYPELEGTQQGPGVQLLEGAEKAESKASPRRGQPSDSH